VTFDVNTNFDGRVGAMIAKATVDGNIRCRVIRYSRVWAIGTGLRVGLKPGEYQITGEHLVNGVPFVQLDGAYHCPADICDLSGSHEPSDQIDVSEIQRRT
jgi:hypothetical protein